MEESRHDDREADALLRSYDRDWAFSMWLTTGLRVAAERFPEEIRSVVTDLFSPEGYRQEIEHLRVSYTKAVQAFHELQGDLSAARRDLERLRQEIDQLRVKNGKTQ